MSLNMVTYRICHVHLDCARRSSSFSEAANVVNGLLWRSGICVDPL